MKLFKAADVCKLAEVQLYVLRSWEKEFPGIGMDSPAEGGRLYRLVDVEQIRRIRQLVFGEGLTVSGARRRLEIAEEVPAIVSGEESTEVLDKLGDDVHARVAVVRDGLQSILTLLSASRPEPAKRATGRTRQAATVKKRVGRTRQSGSSKQATGRTRKSRPSAKKVKSRTTSSKRKRISKRKRGRG
jgi:DNA-binding transcriptional MerR regulator